MIKAPKTNIYRYFSIITLIILLASTAVFLAKEYFVLYNPNKKIESLSNLVEKSVDQNQIKVQTMSQETMEFCQNIFTKEPTSSKVVPSNSCLWIEELKASSFTKTLKSHIHSSFLSALNKAPEKINRLYKMLGVTNPIAILEINRDGSVRNINILLFGQELAELANFIYQTLKFSAPYPAIPKGLNLEYFEIPCFSIFKHIFEGSGSLLCEKDQSQKPKSNISVNVT